MRRMVFMSICLAALPWGCGGTKEPVLAYGKPVNHWLQELKKPESRARKKAVLALGQIGGADPEAIPALIIAVKDPDAEVREKAILALLHLGPAAKDAIPALTEAQNDVDPAIQAQAKKALERIQSGP